MLAILIPFAYAVFIKLLGISGLTLKYVAYRIRRDVPPDYGLKDDQVATIALQADDAYTHLTFILSSLTSLVAISVVMITNATLLLGVGALVTCAGFGTWLILHLISSPLGALAVRRNRFPHLQRGTVVALVLILFDTILAGLGLCSELQKLGD